ncbi:thiamine pyrophosphate-binding protein [Shinella sp. NM-101]|uniref:thiamine pyrophosphate-binding protein n=1 Tax=Shinella sp. NM-101 TaxID=2744455 RepID=UPI001F3914B3|nr:thiamine pyrophosphate-binding protein [Shinella sp. NM-101]
MTVSLTKNNSSAGLQADGDNTVINGAEAAVLTLKEHDVTHVFGLCGDTSLPFYDALARLDHGIEHVLTRDERSAAYMADAYARVTGKPGVCEGPSGGGATYILPGLVEANESSVPVLAITSDVPVTARGKYPLTELDQEALFRPLTKWNTVLDHVEQIPGAFRAAFRSMTTGKPGSAHIGLPYDLQKQSLSSSTVWAQPEHVRYPAFRTAPDPDLVAAAADVILAAKSPLIICGGGVLLADATDELDQFATALDIPVAFTVSGHGVISDAHPLSVGVVGTNGGVEQTREIVTAADTVIFIGCRAGSTSTEHWRVPARNVPIVHIDIDPMVIGANYRCSAGIVADAKLALAALVKEVTGRLPSSIRRNRADIVARLDSLREKKWRNFNVLAQSLDRPIRPERIVRALQMHLPNDAIIAADPGTPCPYFSGYYAFPLAGRHFITNRAQGALGYSLAAAIGAWHGRPTSKCVSVMGDGSFAFTVGELETIVRRRIPLLMIVFSNSSFGWIKASQKEGYGERYFSVDFTRTDHARIAEAYGIKSWRVEDPSLLDDIVKQAIQFDGPALIDVISQPLEQSAVPVSQWMG